MPGVRDGVVKDGTNNLLLMHRPVRSLSLKDAKASNFMFCLMLLMTGPLVWICTLYTSTFSPHYYCICSVFSINHKSNFSFARRGLLKGLKCRTTYHSSSGALPHKNPAGVAYSAPSNPLAGGGARCS